MCWYALALFRKNATSLFLGKFYPNAYSRTIMQPILYHQFKKLSNGFLNFFQKFAERMNTLPSAAIRRFWGVAAPLMDQGIFTIDAFVKIPWSLCSQLHPKSSYHLSWLEGRLFCVSKIYSKNFKNIFASYMKAFCFIYPVSCHRIWSSLFSSYIRRWRG